jgi:enoyl-CoA hydratase/carnithine racemase/predicted RND superfamily exporter protein
LLVRELWSRIGDGVGRFRIAVTVTLVAGVFLALAGGLLERRLRIEPEAPAPGLQATVTAAPARLRAVVPEVARALEALPGVASVSWHVERDYLDESFLLFESLADLRLQAAYFGAHRGGVARVVERGGQVSSFLDALADVIDEEPAAIEDAGLARFLATLRTTVARGVDVDPGLIDRGLQALLLRGSLEATGVDRADRELHVPADTWDRPGPVTARVWIATALDEIDPEGASAFMARAEAARSELRARFSDVGLRLTGGIAAYDAAARALRSDAQRIAVWSLVAILALLVVALRSLAPPALLLLFQLGGAAGALVAQTLLFQRVHVIAAVSSLAVVALGSSCGVAFLLTYQKEMEGAVRERDRSGRTLRKHWLRAVRRAIQRALSAVGASTTAACLIAAAAFAAIAQLGATGPTLQPVRELAVGAAIGLLTCLLLMLVALPAGLVVIEQLRTLPLQERLSRWLRSLGGRSWRGPRWLVWRGRARLAVRTDHERRWFRALATHLERRRLLVAGLSLAIFVAAVAWSAKVEWSNGKTEVEPFEDIVVYAPLDVIRRLHARLEPEARRPNGDIAEVRSIADYLPPAGEAQPDKIELATEIDAALAGVRPALPQSDLVFDRGEVARVTAALARAAGTLAGLKSDAATAAALDGARAQLGALMLALAGARPLEPAAEWRADWTPVGAATLAAAAGACRALADRWLEQQEPQTRIAELKRVAGELAAAAQLGAGALARRDLAAIRLALRRLGVEQEAAGLPIDAGAADVTPVRAARAAVLAPQRRLAAFVADSGIYGLKVRDSDAFAAAVADIEAAVDLVALRARPALEEAGAPSERLRAASLRLRDSLATRKMAAATVALDGLIAELVAVPPAHAESVTSDVDALLSERVFDRLQALRRAAAHARRPLGEADVPASAKRMFSTVVNGQPRYLARVRPRRSLFERESFGATQAAVQAALAAVAPPGTPAGLLGSAVSANLATDRLADTFTGSMILWAVLMLLVMFALHGSALATLVVAAPAIFGVTLTLGFMGLAHLRLSMTTVVAIPIIFAGATSSSMEAFREYRAALAQRGRATLPDVMAGAGKVASIAALATALPFGVMVLGETSGLVELGTIVLFGALASLVAAIVLLPCILSLAQDFVVPAVQYAIMLYPERRLVRAARRLSGRWHDELPAPDPGFSTEPLPEGILLLAGRRPPLNLLDAAMACRFQEVITAFLHDRDLHAMVCVSRLPAHYHVRDAAGSLLLDRRGKPKKIPAAVAESDSLPRGHTLVGPMRPFGAGADLALMALNPLNALFTLRGALENALAMWYAPKPVVFIAEGDMIAGWFEVALYCNHFLVTRHARLGAPEVTLGLTLPFGAHALTFRAGYAVARELMASGELISGEEAVKLGIADGLIPDGEDPFEHAARLTRTEALQDHVRQTSMLRQYGPPMRQLIAKSTRNYVRMLRDPATRRRIGRFVGAADRDQVSEKSVDVK